MIALDVLRLLARRWLTGLAGLVLTAGGVVLASSQVATSYQASGQMLFILPPEATGAETPSNPYLNLAGGMTTTAALIARILSTDDMHTQLEDAGHEGEYTVGVVGDSGPLLDITVKGDSGAEAIETRDVLMDMVDGLLVDLQTEAATPVRQIMRATRPTVSQAAEPIRTATYRAMGAAIGLGLLVTVMLCLAVDRASVFLRSRRARSRTTDVADRVSSAKAATAERMRRPQDEAVPAPEDVVEDKVEVVDPPEEQGEDDEDRQDDEDVDEAAREESSAQPPTRWRRGRVTQPDGARSDEARPGPRALAG